MHFSLKHVLKKKREGNSITEIVTTSLKKKKLRFMVLTLSEAYSWRSC